MPDDVLIVEDLGKRFGAVEAVEGASFSVPRGAFCGLFGRNGSGKSTTLNLITGLLARDAGQITLFGERMRLEPSVAVKARFAFVAGHLQLHHWMTCREHLDYVARFYPTWDKVREAGLLERFAVPLGQRVRTLSTGQYVQLQLVMALSHRPELLLIDEPGNLDAVVRQSLMESLIAAVAEEHTTVLMASHLISELEGICDHMCVLDRGRVLVSGAVDDLNERIKRVRYRNVPPEPAGWERHLAPEQWHGALLRPSRVREDLRVLLVGYTPERAALLGDLLHAADHELEHLALQELFVALTED